MSRVGENVKKKTCAYCRDIFQQLVKVNRINILYRQV